MTTINGKKIQCPDCGGDTIQEFSEAWVSCDIVRFGLHDDGEPFVDEETAITVEDVTSEPQYKCADCGRPFEKRELPTMIAVAGGPVNVPMPSSDPGGREWQVLGRVTIDTATLLLIDPVHVGTNIGKLAETDHAQVSLPGGDFSVVLVGTGMGDGRYRVEGRFADCPFGRRIAEIRVRFLGDAGNYLGGDGEEQ